VAKRSDRGNAKTFKSFLLKVLHTFKGKKVLMVLDNVRYHHAKMLKPFLDNNKD
jgi:putative transposase